MIALTAGLAAGPALGGTNGTADEAVAMVKRAVAAVAGEGRDQTLAAVNAKDPRFVDRDLYVFVWDMNGTTLAHAQNPKMIGKNMADITDTDGKPYARERLELAKQKTSFWSDYKFSNPVTKKIEPKSTYCEAANAMIFCVGIYK
ncbi:cache domain-containing protein [Azospirillum sp. A39]|uniref:cache domain-containing protein n=1 Tax=Azospirillum sp. A39 TaxID=3462279 RepID=UPI0040459B5C